MNKPLYLSHFTPSMMRADLLERLFVQREDMLQRTVERVADSILKKTKHHDLFVGPRGIGKTHFISLLHNRLTQRDDLTKRALIAWMREEEWGITSFAELALRILRTLDESYPPLGLGKEIAKLYDLKPKDVEAAAERLLLNALDGKTLVLLIENLDDLFLQLKDAGQKAWRAFLQNHPVCTVVATTPALFAGIQMQKSPFFGFFRTEKLEKFGFEDAVSLLKKIALERGDESLARVIDSPHGRARLRAVDHLAEGNPRIYIIFAQFLTEQTLDTLVEAFMHTLDELTPYYQSRMKELPGQQRKIVEYLCNYRGAAPVKEIARGCFASHQTCSSQLGELREKGYVKSTESGRESFYELAEPMMRISLEVKKQRGEPIGIFVQILRIWYTQPELSDWLRRLGDGQELDRTYIAKALELAAQDKVDPKVKPIEAALSRALEAKEFGRCRDLLEEWAAIEPSPGLVRQVAHWKVEMLEGNFAAAEKFSTGICKANADVGRALLVASLIFQEAYQRVLDVVGTDAEWNPQIPEGNTLFVYSNRGIAFSRLGRHAEAARDFEKLVAISRNDVRALSELMRCYDRLADHKSAAGIARRLVKLQPDEPNWAMDEMYYLKLAGRIASARKSMLHLFSETYSDKAVVRLLKVLNGQGSLDSIVAAPDFDQARLDSAFCILIVGLAISTGKFESQLLLHALSVVVNGGALSKGDTATLVLLACYLLSADGTKDIDSVMDKIAQSGREHEANLATAILLSVPFGKKHGATESQLADWQAKLDKGFSDYPPSGGVAMSLRLLGAYLEWRRSGDARVVMRLSGEERKLLREMDGENIEIPPDGLLASPLIDAWFLKNAGISAKDLATSCPRDAWRMYEARQSGRNRMV